MQRSEGGGLGIGGNPSGALGARGAADFLTRSTKWLAITFVALSILLAAVAVSESRIADVSSTLDRDAGGDDLLGGPAGGDVPLSAPGGGAAPVDDLLADPGSSPPR